jgi:hypothetical protein
MSSWSYTEKKVEYSYRSVWISFKILKKKAIKRADANRLLDFEPSYNYGPCLFSEG